MICAAINYYYLFLLALKSPLNPSEPPHYGVYGGGSYATGTQPSGKCFNS